MSIRVNLAEISSSITMNGQGIVSLLYVFPTKLHVVRVIAARDVNIRENIGSTYRMFELSGVRVIGGIL